ncbi:MAG: tyrosine--tRNA ligase [Anaerolineales bacterium]|nr:tyrosine--tRNA ligase [Anaerolineales bacterium]MCW5854528.1 tyrosine--tRNA ligase [Anaerolineales bacterium]
MTMTIDEQVATLMQGTEYGDPKLQAAMQTELRERLMLAEKEGRKLRVYAGFDPRTTDLHLGHTIPMRKLRQFQDLGHHVIFLIGTYTSLIGDPSDKDKLRPQLTAQDVEANARTYAEQAFRVLDKDKTEVRYNAEWLSKVDFAQLITFASNFTVQQFLTRENFRERWDKNDPIYLHETFYSIMQAYDAYMLEADVQVGGTDQLFNILTAGRKLMSALGAKPNIGVIMDILPGTDGEIKMSKSLGNHIPLNTDANDMYGKVMSVPDKAMGLYMRLVTRWTASEIAAKEQALADGSLHPRDAKAAIAAEITGIFYGVEAAQAAAENFTRVFQQGSTPEEMPEYPLAAGQSVLDVLLAAGLAASKSEARRLIEQKGVKLDGEVLADAGQPFPGAGVLQVGKRRFVKVVA